MRPSPALTSAGRIRWADRWTSAKVRICRRPWKSPATCAMPPMATCGNRFVPRYTCPCETGPTTRSWCVPPAIRRRWRRFCAAKFPAHGPISACHTIQPQNNFIRWHLVRERLLATLALFFAVVALALAAVGLYGVLNYSVTRQRREISIRMALGARSAHVVRRVTTDIAVVICFGSAIGLAGGLASGRLIEALLFEVKATDLGMFVTPVLTLASVALVAALPPAIRAARVDPAQVLRSE